MATTIVLSYSATVFAGGDTLPPREGDQGYLGENQPVYHGHNAYDVRTWSPETDEYAEFMRARVPLQKRNDAFAATQANPQLDQNVQSLSLAGDYGNEFFNPFNYNDNFAQNLFNFWQYQDVRASWHGTVTNPTPDSLFNPEAEWYDRNYEFGIINIPNPAYTNAAHKNGVMALGCIFFPRKEHTDDFVYQDENGRFPMADKLVEMANYYGFDGWFINAEEALPAEFMPLYQEFCRALSSQGMYVHTYASNHYGPNNKDTWGRIDYYNKTAGNFSNWIKDKDDAMIASNSLYMNPDPSKAHVDGSVKAMEELGLDPKKTVFNTLEAGQTGFAGKRGTLYNTYDENLVPRTGIANLGSTTCWEHLDEHLFGHSGHNSYAENRRGDPDYQKYVFARERAWWAGSMDAPTYENGKGTLASEGLSGEALQQAVLNATFDPVAVANNEGRKQTSGSQTWRGISAFISERSVINGTNFYTSFNTGHGMQYFKDGKVSNDNQWSNINLQDILPTWQWWIDTESQNRLTLDFDYGPKYSAAYSYDQLGGYEGSSSLAIFGKVDAQSDVRLYKTDLNVNANTKFNLTYNKPSADATTLSVVLYLKDGENAVKTVYLPIEASGEATNGWKKVSLDLSKYAGETIAALGISVNGTSDNFQVNLGELAIDDGSVKTPDAPTGFSIDRVFETGEVYLSWELGNYDDVQKYNVYAVYEDGTETYLGGTFDEVYYVKDTIYNHTGNVTFKLTAVGENGKESPAASAAYDFASNASALTATETATGLELSWKNPAIEYASIRADVVFPYNRYGHTETITENAEKDATTLSVAIPFADGSDYTVRLSYLNDQGEVVACKDLSGRLLDNTPSKFEGRILKKTMGDTNKWRIETDLYDWWKIAVWDVTGTNQIMDTATRGCNDLVLSLPGNHGMVYIQVTDFDGNVSDKVLVPYGDAYITVEEMINAIGVVTLESKAAIEMARAAYEALPQNLKEQVSNYETLLEAERDLAYLTGVEEIKKDAEAAKTAAEAAQKAAEEAQAKAEAAKAAAEAAAQSSAEDKAAAEAAKAKAEEAAAQAETAKTAAEAAKKAAEDAAKAAETSNQEAAASARKAAEDAAKTAKDALEAAESARKAAEAQKAAQAAQKAAEDAQAVAEQAKKDAEAAAEAARKASESAASDKSAAEKAKKEAQDAQKAAEDAQKAAEDAETAANAAKDAAEASNEAAAAAAEQAAKSAKEAADYYQKITEMKSQMAKYLEDAQAAKEAAEEAQHAAEAAELACAKYYALFTLNGYADKDDYRTAQQEELAQAIANGIEAINAAEKVEDVEAALAATEAVIDEIPTAAELALPFDDVKEGAWFEDAVRYVYKNNLFKGVSDTKFGPKNTMTRAQMITVLYRLAGEPNVEGLTHPFTDVRDGAYYMDAMIWGFNEGIIKGTSDTTFAPSGVVTRAQTATILYRFENEPEVKEDHLADFPDKDNVPGYARDAINWAVANGLLKGVKADNGTFLAAVRNINRAEAATVIYRYLTEYSEG